MKNIKILVLFLSTYCFSQHNLKGIIIDQTEKKTLEYVTIAIKNKSKGTYSDENGKFSINLDLTKDTLLISSIGYKEVLYYNIKQDSIIISMEKEIFDLEEVVLSPIIKNCKKEKTKFKKPKYHELLIEGTIVKRKLLIKNKKYLCGYSFEIFSNYDTEVTLRSFLTNMKNENLLSNDYIAKIKLIKNEMKEVTFVFNENILIPDETFHLGIEVISLPNNENYENHVQIKCSSDAICNTDVVSVFNFVQQSGQVINFDYKFHNNIHYKIMTSK